MKGLKILAIMGIIVLVIVLGIVMIFISNRDNYGNDNNVNNINQNSNVNSGLTTSWITYNDPDNLFSFKYPADWRFDVDFAITNSGRILDELPVLTVMTAPSGLGKSFEGYATQEEKLIEITGIPTTTNLIKAKVDSGTWTTSEKEKIVNKYIYNTTFYNNGYYYDLQLDFIADTQQKLAQYKQDYLIFISNFMSTAEDIVGEVNTNDSLEYINSAYGYSLKYPKVWSINDSQAKTNGYVKLNSSRNDSFVEIYVLLKQSDADLPDWLNERDTEYESEVITSEAVVINGSDGIKRTVATMGDRTNPSFEIYIAGATNVYELAGLYDNQYKTDVENIINSFEIL
jgi:hypothetical protein